jgi:glycine hydroxymethyltransferase
MIMSSEEIAKKFNFNKAIFPGTQGGPLMHVIAAKAVCFKEALQPEFKEYAQGVVDNAKALCEGLKKRGINIVSGGTDNHLILIDLRPSHPELTGKDAQNALDKANVTTNKNTVPGETRSPFKASGIRLGTPAITSRGFVEADMEQIADIIKMVLDAPENEVEIAKAKAIAEELCKKYPLPPHCQESDTG